MRLLERAHRIRLADDGEGLYSLRGLFAGWDEQRFTAESAWFLPRLGRIDEALDALQCQLSTQHGYPNARAPAAVLGGIALAYTKGDDPEPAHQAALRSLDASDAVGYRVGKDQVARVRDMMPPEWTPLACVRELDEHLGRTA